MAAGARAGRDKLTIVLPDEFAIFGLWIEQLIAESTGKEGLGILPVVGEPLGGPDAYGDDRVFVGVGDVPGLVALADAGHPVTILPFDGEFAEIGGQVLLWELATALAGALLGIQPFDQPDVAAAKAATAEVLESGPPDLPVTSLDDLLAQVQPGDYLAIQAFIDPGSPAVEGIEAARAVLRDRLKVATTVGLGPRFLHSTGQLHKGGPSSGVFVQVVTDTATDVAIPGAGLRLRHADPRPGRRRHGHARRPQAPRRGPATSCCRHADLALPGTDDRGAARQEPWPQHDLRKDTGMKVGMIGLGKMGGNMASRLSRAGHEVVGFDPHSDQSKVGSLAELAEALAPGPRVAWSMVPAGGPTESVIEELGGLLSPGDVVIDGGNSNWRDSVRRGEALAAKGLGFVDCGTSGGVWGLSEGYCLMVGGERRARGHLPAALRHPRAGGAAASSTPARSAPGTSPRWSTTASSTG